MVRTKSALLLAAIGASTLGDWIYLVAINVLVFEMTGSAAAVAGLWVMGPIAAIVTKFWSGSVIDRIEKRRLLIGADLFRGVLVAALPFLHSIWLIDLSLFLLAIAKAFFSPTLTASITALIPKERRKSFNGFQSLLSSGAFLLGPAIAGGILLISTPKTAIWLNAASFFISALLLSFLPRLDSSISRETNQFSFALLRLDWQHVYAFCRKHPYFVTIYGLTQFGILMAMGMDAQEVVFVRRVIGLPASDYGLLISITGIGSVVGAATVSFFSKKISLRAMLGIGYLLVAVGYLIYSFSHSFLSVAIGFIILGFFNAFSGTGWLTFFQNSVPTDLIGRISSVFGTFLAVFQIGLILLIGLTGDLFPLRYSLITASILYLFVSIALIAFVFHPSGSKAFCYTDSRK